MWVAAVYSLTGFAKPSNLKDSYYFPKAWHSQCSCPDFHYFHFWWLKASDGMLQRFHSNHTSFFFFFLNFTQLLFAMEAKGRHENCISSQVSFTYIAYPDVINFFSYMTSFTRQICGWLLRNILVVLERYYLASLTVYF